MEGVERVENDLVILCRAHITDTEITQWLLHRVILFPEVKVHELKRPLHNVQLVLRAKSLPAHPPIPVRDWLDSFCNASDRFKNSLTS